MLAARLTEAGVPPGDVNVVTSSATSEVVDAMLDDLRVCELSFTRVTSVGRILLRKATDQVLNCCMELARLFSCVDGAGGRAARHRVAREEIF
ncbi:aldehyde dehydrogenase family protein [Paenirhodobacter populi]|uniref:aldehyde dehydrogenase family protein n=1 Tax=Paenirhodobacter populi TaxID=2306993 RepID=UPI001F4FF1BA|nr:aldehyde dehydrogenase family protein [Sinirhodobacter populi]